MTKHVLIVDDEESMVFFLSENLADLGPEYQVETACSGEEALDRIADEPFDLVVTGLCLPGISGLELIRRAREISPQTRLILITASGNGRAKAEARRLEVHSYITKPFRIDQFIRAAQEALSSSNV